MVKCNYYVTQDGTMVEAFSLVHIDDPSLTGKTVKKVTKKIFIDLIFCAEQDSKKAIVASTKSKNHTMIGKNISEGKWRKGTKKNKL